MTQIWIGEKGFWVVIVLRIHSVLGVFSKQNEEYGPRGEEVLPQTKINACRKTNIVEREIRWRFFDFCILFLARFKCITKTFAKLWRPPLITWLCLFLWSANWFLIGWSLSLPISHHFHVNTIMMMSGIGGCLLRNLKFDLSFLVIKLPLGSSQIKRILNTTHQFDEFEESRPVFVGAGNVISRLKLGILSWFADHF